MYIIYIYIYIYIYICICVCLMKKLFDFEILLKKNNVYMKNIYIYILLD